MLLENLKSLKKESGMTFKEIADKSHLPESTVKRVFAGDNEPYASTLHRIVKTLGGSLDDILADTNVVLSPKSIVEVKENAEVAEAERDLIGIENERLKAENVALSHKIELLEIKLAHKDELLALHNFYNKLKPNT
jgi:transcriptional regulator with XRE-family HTH domain